MKKRKDSWLPAQLQYKVDVQRPVQTEDDDSGGSDRTYMTLLSDIWAGMKETQTGGSGGNERIAYIRGVQVLEDETHAFIIRASAVQSLGRAFTRGFSSGFKSIEDIVPLKADNFILLKNTTTVGRRFRIRRVKNVGEIDNVLLVFAEELHTVGTGHYV